MEHRQNGSAIVQHHLPVRVADRLLHPCIPRGEVAAPLLPGRRLGQVGAAAGVVGAEVRVRVGVLAPRRQLVVHIAALRRRLCPQRLHLEGGGHLAPHHAGEIAFQRHLLRRTPVLYGQRHVPVVMHRSRLRRGRLRLCRRSSRRQIRPAEQQHRQHQPRRRIFPHTPTPSLPWYAEPVPRIHKNARPRHTTPKRCAGGQTGDNEGFP